MSFLHSHNKVWMDLKTSNWVHFPEQHPDWRLIDLADVAECGQEMADGQGFTSVYAAPEVVRSQALTVHPRMNVYLM